MASKPVVTFIICTYNREAYLDDTLGSILQPGVGAFNIELLVIDNNSIDQTKAVVQKYKKSNDDIFICYVKEEKQGLSHARNRGIKEAKAESIVFLDDDIRADASLVSAWVSFFNNHPKVVAAGGKIHVQFDGPRPVWMSHFLLPLLGLHDLGNLEKKYPKNKFPFGGNMGFRKVIFEEVGFFNTELGRKGTSLGAAEEKELFQRIRDCGKEIFYLPDAFLYHRVNSKRLTVDYIQKQALGLGQSMRLRLENGSTGQKAGCWLSEVGKFLITIPIAAGYGITLNFAKAAMLFRFRRWIWEGYFKREIKLASGHKFS